MPGSSMTLKRNLTRRGRTPENRLTKKLTGAAPLASRMQTRRTRGIRCSDFVRHGVHWLNRKNCCVPVIGLVTVFWPLTTTGAGRLVVQTAEGLRFVVDCKVKPVAVVDQDRRTFWPDGVIVNGGRTTGSEMLNTVP